MGKITYYVKKRIGQEIHSFSVEGKDFHEVIMEARKLSFEDVYVCGICNSEHLELSAHVTDGDGFDYTYVRCKNCRATLNFGQQKKNKDIFYLKTLDIMEGQYKKKVFDWKPYVPEQK